MVAKATDVAIHAINPRDPIVRLKFIIFRSWKGQFRTAETVPGMRTLASCNSQELNSIDVRSNSVDWPWAKRRTIAFSRCKECNFTRHGDANQCGYAIVGSRRKIIPNDRVA